MRLLTLPVLVFLSLALQGQSVLSSGQWFQFSVITEGIYKISAGQLRDAGLDIGKTNPKNIKLYGGCFGMLPQPNRAERINALQEMAIMVSGEEDGVFNDSDYILFYGQNPDRFLFNPAKNIYDYENNYFTDFNFYFLTAGATAGKRIPTPAPVAGSFPVVSRFNDFHYQEKDIYNLLNTGRQWFGEAFFRDKNEQPFDYKTDVTGIVPNSNIYFVSRIAVKFPLQNASFDITINDKLIKTQTVPPVANVTYEPIANLRTDTVVVKTSDVGADGGELLVKYEFKPSESDKRAASGYIDFFTFTFLRKLALYGDRTFFTCGESLQQPVSTFTIDNAGGQTWVWDVTDPFNVVKETLTLNGTSGSFNSATSTLKRFTVFDIGKAENTSFVKKVPNQDLASLRDIQYLVITHDNFLEQAKRLADHRTAYNKIKTAVVTVEQIYNEFSGGKQDITALRDFIHSLYWSSNKGLKNVLLFGRGAYDYRNLSQAGGNYVPIYESRESVSPKSSYASDDYLGMLAIEQGEWPEDVSGRDSVAVGLGRIPCQTAAAAQIMVDKIIDYETGSNRFGDWHSSFLFVADDGDSQLHMDHADKLAKKIETNHNELIVKRLFLDNFEQITSSGSQTSPEMSHAFAQSMDQGYAVINFTGHGSVSGLTHERIVDDTWIKARRNSPRYPFFFTATCDFGRNDNPIEVSGGETLLLMKGGGIIGLVSSVRPVLASNNFKLNNAFYEALFKLDGTHYRSLGTIFKEAKNNGVDAVNGRNYMYLGDPGLTLPFPRPKITISSIGNTNPPKIQALSPITVTGQVTGNGNPLTHYSGDLRYIVFDRPLATTTRGDEGSDPFTYSEWTNQLAGGTVPVKNGEFQFDMILSKNFTKTGPPTRSGYPDKLKLFFYSNDGATDYGGFEFAPPVQEVNPDAPVDNTAPALRLYLNDQTFVSGGVVGTTSKFFAFLEDDHGIDLSNVDPETRLRMVIDDEKSYDLAGYYSTIKGDYTKGRIDYLMSNIGPGIHRLTLHAADTYGNKASATIAFSVSEKLAAAEFVAFPNPANVSTQFTFTRSQLEDDMEGSLEIFSTQGLRVAQMPVSITSKDYRIVLTDWDLTVSGRKIAAGLYLARLTLRSMSNSTITQVSARLVIYY